MEFLDQLRAIFCGPQGPFLGALVVLIVQRLWPNLKLPSLPGPAPQPSPIPLPVIFPNPDGSPRFPILRKLLEMALAGGILRLEDVPVSELKAVRGELDAALAERAEKVRSELRSLE